MKMRISAALMILFPCVTFAAGKTLSDLMSSAAIYLNKGLLLLMGLAVLMFVWYTIQFFIRPSESDRTEGSKYLMWSVIGFFVILSFWGFVNILQNSFGLDYGKPSTWGDVFPGSSTGTASSNPGNSSFGSTPPAASSPSSGTASSNSNQGTASSNPTNNSGGSNTTAPAQRNPFTSTPRESDYGYLSQYYESMYDGASSGDRRFTDARAIDLANKNGVQVYQDSDIQYTTTGGVPTAIIVDGKTVPISQKHTQPSF